MNFKTNKRHKLSEEEEEKPIDEDVVEVIEDRVYFYAEVNTKNVMKLIKAMNTANEHALKICSNVNDCRVYLYINSYGGCAFSGLSALDNIRNNKVWVVTIADGFVASAATLLLLAGYERKCYSHAKILIHQLKTSFWGKHADLLDEVENCTELMETLKEVYVRNSRMKADKVQDLLNKELHLNAETALKKGFVDAIW